jgi:signal transduction histidine kinase
MLVTFISLAVAAVYILVSIKGIALSKAKSDLVSVAHLSSDIAAMRLASDKPEIDNEFCITLGRQSGTRITMIAADGRVVCDSEDDPGKMENHAARPEVKLALEGKTAVSFRKSPSLDRKMMYAAVPVISNGRVAAVMRSSMFLTFMNDTLGSVYESLILGVIISACIAGLVGLFISRHISRPLIKLKNAAERFACGDLEQCISVDGAEEIRALAAKLNHMAAQLKKLETIRRDFVANVSHELKTPVTSIRGFVETLVDGDIEDEEESKRFLGIILKQTDRLEAIIEDLLALSRLEQGLDAKDIEFENASLHDTLASAVQSLDAAAKAKRIDLCVSCQPDLKARLNPLLLGQAMSNLIDNAIKYSDAGKAVFIDARQKDTEILISVRDDGCGISEEHIGRIFERFYRVDKARSRASGGTGLGLAIVKHIVNMHGGRIDVESTPGKGSTFTIHLPAR